MSTPKPHTAAQPRTGVAMGMRGCVEGEACTSDRPGHGLHPMQERLSRIAASRWIDAIVVAAASDGFVELVDLEGGAHRVWHHGALTGGIAVGDPGAQPGGYGRLARGAARVSGAAI